MKTLREMAAAALLTCVLAVAASAGDIHAGHTSHPPPPEHPTGTTNGETGGVLTEVIVPFLSGLLTVL